MWGKVRTNCRKPDGNNCSPSSEGTPWESPRSSGKGSDGLLPFSSVISGRLWCSRAWLPKQYHGVLIFYSILKRIPWKTVPWTNKYWNWSLLYSVLIGSKCTLPGKDSERKKNNLITLFNPLSQNYLTTVRKSWKTLKWSKEISGCPFS